MARRNANLIRRRANPRNTGCTAASGQIIEHPVSTRNNGRRATLAVRTSQLSPTNCCNSRSHSSSNRPSRMSNSPSPNTLCRDMLSTSSIPNLPVSPFSPARSRLLGASFSSSRICINRSVSSNSGEYPHVHSSYRNSEGSSMLVSPDHPWSSTSGVVAAAEMLGSRPPRKNMFCRVSIPLRELNER